MKELGVYLTFDDKKEKNNTPGQEKSLNSCVTMETPTGSELKGKPLYLKFNWYTSYEGYIADNF